MTSTIPLNIPALRKRVQQDDPAEIAYILRDTPRVVAADLNDLAWALSEDGFCSCNDVMGLLDLLEEAQE